MDSIDNATIEALATDSAEHGDLLQTAICYRALGWDKSLASTALDADERAKVDAMTPAAARAACERVIADARAQADA